MAPPAVSVRLQLFLPALLLISCAPRTEVAPAFYWWKTTFRLQKAERDALARGCERLYIRYFDVDWDKDLGMPVPVAPISFRDPVPEGIEPVPVVFLRDEVFRRTDSAGVAALARHVWNEVRIRSGKAGVEFGEVQFDCDWSDGTRAGYFRFLSILSDSARPKGIQLSATIRLHQVKYRERTGIPPVARGMLMFYNMGRISADPQGRAILDQKEAAKYLGRLEEYPLPLDVALPLWSWTIVSRRGRVVNLFQRVGRSELDTLPWVERTRTGGYRARQGFFLHGDYVTRGDDLKTESVGIDDLRAAARLLARHLSPAPSRSVALFDLEERNLRHHALDDLHDLYRAFR